MALKKLDAAQRKYVEKRLAELVEQKTSESLKRHTTEGRELSGEERVSAIKAGKFKVKAGVVSIGKYTDVVDVLVFNDEKPSKVNNEAHLKDVLKIKRDADAIMDELMMIDAEGALEKLRAFERSK